MDQKDLKLKNQPKLFFLFFALIFTFKCTQADKINYIPMSWSKFELKLPKGIEIYSGSNNDIPLRAWVAKVDLNDDKIYAEILSSSDKDHKDSPSQFLEKTGARLVMNGGFFNDDKTPIQHVGLLKTSGILEEPASHSIYRDSERFFISRGAFGIHQNGKVDIAWCSTKNDSIFQWDRPLINRPGYPNSSISFANANYWDVHDAIHAGPVLISEGKIDLTLEDEVFFNTPVAGIQPRSAIGYNKDGRISRIHDYDMLKPGENGKPILISIIKATGSLIA